LGGGVFPPEKKALERLLGKKKRRESLFNKIIKTRLENEVAEDPKSKEKRAKTVRGERETSKTNSQPISNWVTRRSGQEENESFTGLLA